MRNTPLILGTISFIVLTFLLNWLGKFHFFYIEQLQLFQFTWDYFREMVASPGGFSLWVGEFLTQFFILPYGGPVILALFLTLIVLMCRSIIRRLSPSRELYLLYFLPVGIPFKISFPLGVLAVFSLWLVPLPMSFAFFASAAGDFMGAAGNFMGQMECFAVAHLFLILYFMQKLFKAGRMSSKSFSALMTGKRVAYVIVVGCGMAVLLLSAMVRIVPEVPSGVERGGVAFYCLIILLMLFFALMQRSVLYALGAMFFVFSDFILAWNRYVEPVA